MFLTGIVEGELGDMFLTFMKKLGVSQQVDKLNKDLGHSASLKNGHDLEENLKEEVKLELKAISERFDKYMKVDESSSGVLNNKKINLRFADFRKKLEVWKERHKVRERFKRNF